MLLTEGIIWIHLMSLCWIIVWYRSKRSRLSSTWYASLTTVGLPLLMSWLTSWKMLLQLMDLSREPLFTITATANRICSRTYFCRLQWSRKRFTQFSYTTIQLHNTLLPDKLNIGYTRDGFQKLSRGIIVCCHTFMFIHTLTLVSVRRRWGGMFWGTRCCSSPEGSIL